jgi:molecular chaperone DnaK
VGGSTRIPKLQQILEKSGFKLNRNLNPDEASVVGAAILGSILAGIREDNLLLEVLSHDIAVQTPNGMEPILIKNSTIPTKKEIEINAANTISLYEGDVFYNSFEISDITTEKMSTLCECALLIN